MMVMLAYLAWILVVLFAMARLFQAVDGGSRPAQPAPVKVRLRD